MTGTVKSVKEKTKLFLSDRRNANNLVEIISLCESEDDEVVLACIRSLHKIFSLLIAQRDMTLIQQSAEIPEDAGPEERFRFWLLDRYNDTHNSLRDLLQHQNAHLQELALCTIMKLLESEGNTPFTKRSPKTLAFPVSTFESVLESLLSSEQSMVELIARFQEYMEYDDVRYLSLKYCHTTVKERKTQELTDTYLENLHCLLEILLPPKQTGDDKLSKFLVKLPDGECSLANKIQTHSEHKKIFSKVWVESLGYKLPTSLYKKILVNLHEKVIPGMSNPLLLSDFLTTSYNIGGAISLLALNGLFVLVNYYNLEYPDFYKKLYRLFEPSVFHVKYRARFFFLADLFLTSTHLPGYLVAAFIKRLSRLTLTAPPNGLEIVIPFIYNLLVRHPNCKVLVHRPNGPSDLTSDPFKMEEDDPTKCNALESSLWELKTMQQHYHYFLAKKANQISRTMHQEETPLGDLLEMQTADIFQKEVKSKVKEMPVTFVQPKGLFNAADDQFSDLWSLE